LQINNLGLAERLGQTARSGGLWGAANQASHAFLFAPLLSMWVPGIWACLAWVAALIGIFLASSRQGTYLLALSAMVYAAHLIKISLRTQRLRFLKKGLIAALLVGGLFIWYYPMMARESNRPENFARVFAFENEGELDRTSIASFAYEKIWEFSPFVGSGAFSFRHYLINYGNAEGAEGCYNMYLAIWGEGGLFMLLAYLAVMVWGLERIFRAKIASSDQVPLLLMWVCYMLVGLAYHGQMGDFDQMMVIAMLFALPIILVQPCEANASAVGGFFRDRRLIRGYSPHNGISRSRTSRHGVPFSPS